MTVNVNMKKMVIIVVVILIAIGCVWKYMENAPQRRAKAEIETMIDVLQGLTLKVAIIEKSVKLAGYRKQIAANQPKPPTPFVVKDPNDN